MRVFATGVVDGPEARGIVWVVEYEDGRLNVELTDLWVAPGAPDVLLYTSPYPDGRIDGTATDLRSVPHDTRELRRALPPDATATTARSVVVYCGSARCTSATAPSTGTTSPVSHQTAEMHRPALAKSAASRSPVPARSR